MTAESPEPTVKEKIRKAQKEAYLVSLLVGLFALWMGYYWVTPNDTERFEAWDQGYAAAEEVYKQRAYCDSQPTQAQQEECYFAWGESLESKISQMGR